MSNLSSLSNINKLNKLNKLGRNGLIDFSFIDGCRDLKDLVITAVPEKKINFNMGLKNMNLNKLFFGMAKKENKH